MMLAAVTRLTKEFRTHKKTYHSNYFKVSGLVDNNVMQWEVYIIGPPDTAYENGVYKAHLKFPEDYPFKPPSIEFKTEIYHPNIYKNGKVCISTLQTGTNNQDSGQFWRPSLSVEHALLSVVSLLSDPNLDDPAHAEAANKFKDKHDEYLMICKRNIEKSLEALPKDFERPKVAPSATKEEKQEEPEEKKEIVLDESEGDDEDWDYDLGEEDSDYEEDSDEENDTDETCDGNSNDRNYNHKDDDNDDANQSFPGSNVTNRNRQRKTGHEKKSSSKSDNNNDNSSNTEDSENIDSHSHKEQDRKDKADIDTLSRFESSCEDWVNERELSQVKSKRKSFFRRSISKMMNHVPVGVMIR